MWQKIRTWHWTMLVAIISVLSVFLFQQQVLAQWTPPDDTPGGTTLGHIVVTPMEEDLNLGGFTVVDPTADAAFYLDPANPISIKAKGGSFDQVCIAGVCKSVWPSSSSSAGESLWSTSTINSANIYYSDGKVGIGTNDPKSALHVASDVANGSDLRLLNTTGDMSIIFQEYTGPSDNGDFFVTYNGGTGGFANWLEFKGKPGSQNLDDGRPVMTLQRDYNAPNNTYKGVGIGVPQLMNINAKLRVQNYGTEDILQLYDGNTLTFQVKDGGAVGIAGTNVHSATPLFINGSGGTTGLKLYPEGIHSWNTTNLELKATNDIYLNPGADDGVGVEVINPQQILHVKNTSNFTDALLRLENANSSAFLNQTTQMEFVRGPNWGTDYSWVGPTDENTFDVWTMENIPILFGTNGYERLRITETDIVPSGYLHFDKTATAPPATDCDVEAEVGRVKLNNLTDTLYICTGNPSGGFPAAWKTIAL